MRRTTWWAVLVTVIVLLGANLLAGRLAFAPARHARPVAIAPALWGARAADALADLRGSLAGAEARVRAGDEAAAGAPLARLSLALALAALSALALGLALGADPRRRALRLIRRGQPAATVARRTRLARDAVRQLARPGSRAFRPRRRGRKLLPPAGAPGWEAEGRLRCGARA